MKELADEPAADATLGGYVAILTMLKALVLRAGGRVEFSEEELRAADERKLRFDVDEAGDAIRVEADRPFRL